MLRKCLRQPFHEAHRHSLWKQRGAVWLALSTAVLLTTPSITIAQEVETKTAPSETGTQSAPTEADTPAGPAEAGTQTTSSEADAKAADTKAEDKATPTESKSAPKEEFPDRFMIRGGWNYVFNADTTFSLNGPGGTIGTTIDFARNLSGQREDNLWRIDSLYRFNPRHSIGFSYYDVTRKGERTLDRDLTVRDRTFAVGGNVSSELRFKMYRFIYNYSFHHDEKVELAGSFGLYFANVGASLNANLTCTGVIICGPGQTLTPGRTSNNLTVPLPSIGFLVNYHFTPRLMATARFDWFYIETAQFKGAMNEVYFGLEYRLFKHFALGGAYDRLDVNADVDPNKGSGFSFKTDWNTLFLYGSLYF